MNLRKAKLKDKKYILEITNLLYLNMPDFVWNNDEFVKKQIEKGEYFLMEAGGNVAGIISFRQRKNKMHIETLAVKKEWQSKGIGTQLVEFAKSFTKEKGLDILCACAFYKYKSVNFYLRQGFSLLPKSGAYNNHKYYRFAMKI